MGSVDQMSDERPSLEDLRELRKMQRRNRADREVEKRFAKAWCLAKAGEAIREKEKLVPEGDQERQAWLRTLKASLSELWETFDFPPDGTLPRPYKGWTPSHDPQEEADDGG